MSFTSDYNSWHKRKTTPCWKLPLVALAVGSTLTGSDSILIKATGVGIAMTSLLMLGSAACELIEND